MILQGNQRAGGRDLANHLLKDENDHVEVHEIRGFVSDDLHGAFKEAYAVSKGTKAKQYLYSLSLNPPANEKVSTQDFEDAITKAEKKLNLTDQPRAIVFHEKEGRRHCHVVWSRINTQEMKAVHLPHSKRKLMEVSRDLYIQHGWQMPQGMIDGRKASRSNMTFGEWQQARRLGKDPRTVKQAFQDAWASSDNKAAFAAALKERGYVLAKGDRRGFVALDHHCNVFAISKWVGVKAKDTRAKMGEPESLPSANQAKTRISGGMIKQLEVLKKKQRDFISARQAFLDQQKADLVMQQKQERQRLEGQHAQRQQLELQDRQSRLRKGLAGLWDRVTGKYRQIIKQNQLETDQSLRRDRQEKDTLIFQHVEQRQKVTERKQRLQDYSKHRDKSLTQDIQQYQEIKDNKRDAFETIKDRGNDRDQGLER